MLGLRTTFRGLLLLVFGLFWAVQGSAAQPEATAVRLGQHPQTTRLVIDLSGPVKFEIFTLADPYRVVIDLPEITWAITSNPRGRGRGLVAQYRYGLFQPGNSRVVLDAKGPVAVKRAFVIPPRGRVKHYRLVLDLKRTDAASFRAAAGPRRRAPPRQAVVRPARKPNDFRRVIAIDAGHGGIDPGAAGVNGLPEKTITLAVARELKRVLDAGGRYRPILTRDRDVFVPLRERVRRARRAGADLLISIHADSLKNRKVRGATVYTLSERASDQEAAALAAKENKSDVIAGVDLDGASDDVTNILIDLAQRETMNYSAQLAALMVPELGHHVTLRSNSHRFAGFRVLKAPDVPSVLVEMGYLSNPEDAQLMSSPSGRRGIAEAVFRAIERFFRERRT